MTEETGDRRGHDTQPPDANKEGEKYTNWHCTYTGSSWSVGLTDKAPGFYPANEQEGLADSVVAPGDFIEKYLKSHGEEMTDAAVYEAIMEYQKQM